MGQQLEKAKSSSYERLEYTNVEDLLKKMITDFRTEMKGLGHVNIIIAGKTGVGKSTLINAAFREHLAETGMGKPVTSCCRRIEKEGVPIRIYDTVGLELNEERKRQSIDEIRGLIQEKIDQGPEHADEFIHCVWYCVQSDSDRFEESEQEFVRMIAEECDIPVILVITKAYLKKHAKEFASEISGYNLPIRGIAVLLAQAYEDEDFSAKPYGVPELVQKTLDVLPESARRAWVNAQQASLELKRQEATTIIKQTVSLAFGAGYTPLPMSDAVVLAPIQITMFIRITSVYGISMSKGLAASIASSFLGIAGATYAGRTIASNLIKLIPGIGTAIGGTISGGTAAMLTWALGRTYIEIMEKLFLGELRVEDLEKGTVRETIENLLRTYLKKEKDE